MLCERDGCKKLATHMPVLCVPTKGWPRGSHSPMQMFCGIQLCKFHANEFMVNPLDEGNEKLREVIEIVMRASGKLPPDFARAWLEYKKVDSPEVVKFLSIQDEGKNNADAKNRD